LPVFVGPEPAATEPPLPAFELPALVLPPVPALPLYGLSVEGSFDSSTAASSGLAVSSSEHALHRSHAQLIQVARVLIDLRPV
jgi:hypothetical protein